MIKNVLWISLLLFGFTANANTNTQIEHQIHVEHWMITLENSSLVLVRKNAARFLGDLQDRIAVPTLIRALEDPDTDVRQQVIRSLGLLGDPSAINPLFEVSAKEQGSQLAREAQRSIERIRAYVEFKKNQRGTGEKFDDQLSQ